MTVTVAEQLDAGINDLRFAAARDPARAVPVPDFVPESWSRTKSAQLGPSPETIVAELNRLRQGPSARERARKLAVLLAKFEGLTFDEAATLLDQKPKRLAEMVHGRTPVPASMEDRLDALGQIVVNVHQVLQPVAFRSWLYVDAPQLKGGSPIAAIRHGRIRDVVALTREYGQPSFT
jgi:hypothetical protein